ncbi:hypothetical protein CEXT_51301 [Caerostris extrusa]|uniref:Uncharacterized protein n=1 Tax=Caerostris extrusa TaxID=172846 RepID=A0AAV4W0A6_CAEEX|nr:hypothetical protein CEXT_51301 [Caerostris extrusa]
MSPILPQPLFLNKRDVHFKGIELFHVVTSSPNESLLSFAPNADLSSRRQWLRPALTGEWVDNGESPLFRALFEEELRSNPDAYIRLAIMRFCVFLVNHLTPLMRWKVQGKKLFKTRHRVTNF